MEDIYREIHSYNGCQSSFSINLYLSFTSFVGICQPSVIALFSLQFYDFEVFRIFIGKSAVLPKVSFTFPPPSQIFTPRYIICRTRDFPIHCDLSSMQNLKNIISSHQVVIANRTASNGVVLFLGTSITTQ